MKKITFIFLLTISLSSQAADTEVKSVRMGAVNSTYALLIPDRAIPTPKPSCATSDILVWDKTTEEGKLLFSLVLAAHMANKNMLVGYDDNVCANNGRLLLKKVHIYQ